MPNPSCALFGLFLVIVLGFGIGGIAWFTAPHKPQGE